MLNSVNELTGCTLVALGGAEMGTVREVYFDDAQWVIRHLVVDTSGWLAGRRVLISPHAVQGVDLAERRVGVALTREQVQDAPSADTDRPVSRQQEAANYDYYGYPYYWGGNGLWGMMDLPLGGAIAPIAPVAGLTDMPDEAGASVAAARRAQAQQERADPNLRSSSEVRGYDVAASDGDIGHVHDFLFNAQSWQVELLVVDVHNWLPDRLVLVPSSWVGEVDWSGHRAVFKVTRQAVQDSPAYEPLQRVDADAALRVQRHFEGMV